MPRNLAGKFIVINTFVPGTTITALAHNENWADAANEISNSLAADGQTPMSGPLKAIAGSAATPALTFSADPDTGMYRAGTDTLGFAAGGVAKLTVSPTVAVLTVPLQGPDFPFPTGTRMLFNQAAAPVNWVKEVSLHDRVLRLVSGNPTNAGFIGFSSFLNRTTTDFGTLTTANLPGHTHSGGTAGASADHTHSWGGTFGTGTANSSLDHTHNFAAGYAPAFGVTAGPALAGAAGATGGTTGGLNNSIDHTHNVSVGGNTGPMSASHTHSFTTNGGDGVANSAFTLPIDCRIAYTDVIIAQRS
jgi:hypothetical protein